MAPYGREFCAQKTWLDRDQTYLRNKQAHVNQPQERLNQPRERREPGHQDTVKSGAGFPSPPSSTHVPLIGMAAPAGTASQDGMDAGFSSAAPSSSVLPQVAVHLEHTSLNRHVSPLSLCSDAPTQGTCALGGGVYS